MAYKSKKELRIVLSFYCIKKKKATKDLPFCSALKYTFSFRKQIISLVLL